MLSYCKAIAFTPPFYSFHFLSTPSLREGMRRVSFFRRYSLPYREGWGGSLILRVGEGLWAGSLIFNPSTPR